MKMKNAILLVMMLTFGIGSVFAQTDYDTISATYTVGDISTDDAFNATGNSSTCPGVLNVNVPPNSVIVSVDVEYDMTSIIDAVTYDQLSQLRCTSPGGSDEPEVYRGEGWSQGTYSYNRTGLNIANGVTPFIFGVDFELHACNDYWGAPLGCSDVQMVVDDGTWTVTVIYLAAGSPGLPTNPGPADMAQLVDVDSDLTWDFGANTTSYDVYFGTDNPPMTKVVDDASTAGGSGSFDPGTMVTGTTYYWYVVDRNTQNEIAGPVWSFSTDCGVWTLPYFDDFESYAWETLPSCWLSENTVDNPDCYVRVEANWQAYSGGNTMSWVNYGSEFDPNITLVLPKAGTVSDYMISFYAKNGSNPFWGTPYYREFQIGTMSDPFDANTFTELTSFVPDAFSWEYFEYLFLGVSTTDEFIAIRGDLTMDENQMFMDDFSLDLIPSCIKPLDVIASDIQANEVELSWTDYSTPVQWTIEYGAPGYTPGTGTQEIVYSNPATISGLTDATDYDFYVQGDCGGGDISAWSTVLSLQTACLPYAVPLFEDFGEMPPYPNAPEWPLCWSHIEINGSQWGGMGLGDYDAYTGVCIWFSPEGDPGSELIAITPEFSDGLNTLYVNFWSLSSGTEVVVGTITDPADETTFTGYDTVYTDGNVYQNHSVYFNAYMGTDTRIAFKPNAVDYTFSQLKLDDITIETIPSCVEPYKPWIDGETQNSAMLNWYDALESATDWQIEVGAPGFAPGTGAEINAYTYNNTAEDMHSYDMTGLMSATTYDAFIRTDCGASDYSVWVGPFTFLTLFDAFGAMPVNEDFESGMGITGNDPANGTNWSVATDLQHGGLNSIHNAYDADNDNVLYMLGTFDFTAKADVMLSFWQIAKTEGNGDQCYIEISTDGGATYDQLPESTYVGAGYYRNDYYAAEGPYFDEDSYPEWGTWTETPDNSWWRKEYFDLTSYNTFDNVIIRFRLVSNGWDLRAGWYLDDISVESLGSPLFYVDPLSITETATPLMPAATDLNMGNSGSLPTTYSASVVYNELDLEYEDFNAGTPAGWTIINNGNNAVTWVDTNSVSGYTFDGTRCMVADGYQGYAPQANTMDDELISPVIDASAYIGGGLLLEYDHSFNADWTDGDTAYVYVYDGSQWIEIYKSGEDDGALSWNSNGVHKSFNVSQYANANFQVKFRYTEDDLGRGQFYAIDNFRIRASMSALGWLTIDGAEVTSGTSLPDADMLPSMINVNMDATGLATGVYNANIEITSTDPAFTTTLVPVTFNVIAGYTISGTLTYANAGLSILEGCTIDLLNDNSEVIFSTTSDASGYYEFTALLDGDYSLMTTTTIVWGGLSMNDVQFARQYVTNQAPGNGLTGLPLLSADVDQSGGAITMNDVQFMRQVVTATPPGFAEFWLFEEPAVNVGGGNVTQDIQGICAGDTDGSYTPPAK